MRNPSFPSFAYYPYHAGFPALKAGNPGGVQQGYALAYPVAYPASPQTLPVNIKLPSATTPPPDQFLCRQPPSPAQKKDWLQAGLDSAKKDFPFSLLLASVFPLLLRTKPFTLKKAGGEFLTILAFAETLFLGRGIGENQVSGRPPASTRFQNGLEEVRKSWIGILMSSITYPVMAKLTALYDMSNKALAFAVPGMAAFFSLVFLGGGAFMFGRQPKTTPSSS